MSQLVLNHAQTQNGTAGLHWGTRLLLVRFANKKTWPKCLVFLLLVKILPQDTNRVFLESRVTIFWRVRDSVQTKLVVPVCLQSIVSSIASCAIAACSHMCFAFLPDRVLCLLPSCMYAHSISPQQGTTGTASLMPAWSLGAMGDRSPVTPAGSWPSCEG